MSREPNDEILSNRSTEPAVGEENSSATGVFGKPLPSAMAPPSESAFGAPPPVAAPAMPAVREVVFKPSASGASLPPGEAVSPEGFTQIFNLLKGRTGSTGVQKLPSGAADEPGTPVVSSPSGGEFTQLLRTITSGTPDAPPDKPFAARPNSPAPAPMPAEPAGQFTQLFGSMRTPQSGTHEPPRASGEGSGFTDLFDSLAGGGQAPAPPYTTGSQSSDYVPPSYRPMEEAPAFAPSAKAPPAEVESFTTLIRKLDDPQANAQTGRDSGTPSVSLSPVAPVITQTWRRGGDASDAPAAGATRVFSRGSGPAAPSPESERTEYSPIRRNHPPPEPLPPPPPAAQAAPGAWPGAAMPPAAPYMHAPHVPPVPYPGYGAPGGAAPAEPGYAAGYPRMPAPPPVPAMPAPSPPNKLQQMVPLLLLFNILLEIVILAVVLFALKH